MAKRSAQMRREFRAGVNWYEWLRTTERLSQFRRPEVQNQGIGKVGSFWGLWGKDLRQAFLLGLQMTVFCIFHMVFSLCTCLSVQISLFINIWTQSSFFFFCPYFFNLFFYWSIVNLQCCVNFCCTAKWLSYTHIYILFYILFHYGLS